MGNNFMKFQNEMCTTKRNGANKQNVAQHLTADKKQLLSMVIPPGCHMTAIQIHLEKQEKYYH